MTDAENIRPDQGGGSLKEDVRYIFYELKNVKGYLQDRIRPLAEESKFRETLKLVESISGRLQHIGDAIYDAFDQLFTDEKEIAEKAVKVHRERVLKDLPDRLERVGPNFVYIAETLADTIKPYMMKDFEEQIYGRTGEVHHEHQDALDELKRRMSADHPTHDEVLDRTLENTEMGRALKIDEAITDVTIIIGGIREMLLEKVLPEIRAGIEEKLSQKGRSV